MNITIPTSLKDITLRQYKHFLKIQETVKEERFLNAKMIEIFCGVNLEQVMLLKLKDSAEIISILTEMFEEKPPLVTMFKLNGVDYGFQPQLDDITLGEYIDLDTFIGDWGNMEKAMNVLYRPVLVKMKGKYSIEEYQIETSENILDMPMHAVLSSIFFLWYQSIYALAQGDIGRIENITSMKAHECFMMLSYMKEKKGIEAKQMEKNFK